MEESAEIKVDTSISRTSRMQSYLAAGGKRISSALSYVTGEMKECGEGLKGKAAVTVTPDPAFQRSPPVIPRKHLVVVLCRLHCLSFEGRHFAVRTDTVSWDVNAILVGVRAFVAEHAVLALT